MEISTTERMITMFEIEMPVDTIVEYPKFKCRRARRASGSPPGPMLHSPPKLATVKDEQHWRIPPCVPNWKYPPLVSLASVERGLRGVQIKDFVAKKLSEDLCVAEQRAGEAVAMRSRVQREFMLEEKGGKDQELRDLAQEARSERTGITPAPAVPVPSNKAMLEEHVPSPCKETREKMKDWLQHAMKADSFKTDKSFSGVQDGPPGSKRERPFDPPKYPKYIKCRIVSRAAGSPPDPEMHPPECPKYIKHRTVSRASGSPPDPEMYHPPSPVAVKDPQDCKIPVFSISNWKDLKGYMIPLDRRFDADGKGLQEVEVGEEFAKLLEALFLAEQKAREALTMRSNVQRELIMEEKERKEQELRALERKMQDLE